MATPTTQPLYLAVYVRILHDKHAPAGERIRLHTTGDGGSPIHLCGTPTTLAEAEHHARQTVNDHGPSVRGTVLPRVFRFGEGENLLDVGDRAEEWYEKLLTGMNETDLIASRGEAPA